VCVLVCVRVLVCDTCVLCHDGGCLLRETRLRSSFKCCPLMYRAADTIYEYTFQSYYPDTGHLTPCPARKELVQHFNDSSLARQGLEHTSSRLRGEYSIPSATQLVPIAAKICVIRTYNRTNSVTKQNLFRRFKCSRAGYSYRVRCNLYQQLLFLALTYTCISVHSS